MADLTITEVQTPEAVARDKATAVRVCGELGMTDEKSVNLAFTAILGARFDDTRRTTLAQPATREDALRKALERIASDHIGNDKTGFEAVPINHIYCADCDACHRQQIARAALSDSAKATREDEAVHRKLLGEVNQAIAIVAARAIRSAFFTSVSGEKPHRYHLSLAYPTMEAMHAAEDAIKGWAKMVLEPDA